MTTNTVAPSDFSARRARPTILLFSLWSPAFRFVLTNHKRLVPLQFALNTLRQDTRLQFETAEIRRLVAKDGMLDLGLLAFLILDQKFLAGVWREATHIAEAEGEVARLEHSLIEATQDYSINDKR